MFCKPDDWQVRGKVSLRQKYDKFEVNKNFKATKNADRDVTREPLLA